ncbi:odorant receptor Or2-like [Schistocerca americana]|uniref:odorant receptor Or2-like n=1 Tax=Schistocerca americana TaxID=7009 RepID=UPI001F4F497A|nr:odorant receptor Or2-like [Schistocerca americana]
MAVLETFARQRLGATREHWNNVLRRNVKVLRFGGVWRPASKSGWRSCAFPLYFASVCGSLLNIIGLDIVRSWLLWGDMTEVTFALVSAMTNVNGVFKMVHCFRHFETYSLLVSELNGLVALQRPYCEGNGDLMAAFRKACRRAARLTIGCLTYMNVLGQMWCVVPLVSHVPPDSRESPLPLVSLPGLHRENRGWYLFAYLVECHAVFYWNFASLGMDMFFASIMIQVTGQLNILNIRLTQLRQEGSTEDRASLSRSTGFNLSRNDRHQERSADNFTRMNSELCECVKHHQAILKYLEFLERVMSPVVLTQFLCSVVAVCVTLYQITFNPEGSGVIKCAMFLPIPALQIFVYCWCGHDIMEAGLSVSLAAYSCAWMGVGRRVTSALRIVMCRAQRPLQLTAGKVYPVNRDTFLSLINASYTFYTLLRQMRNR